MSLPNVAQGAPHVAAHNAERAAINDLETNVQSLNDSIIDLVITNMTIIEDPADPGFAIIEMSV